MRKTWKNTDGCDEQYRFDSEMYLLSVMTQCYSGINYQGISAPRHGREVVDRLNAVDKRYIYHLMYNAQLTGSNRFDYKMEINTGNQNNNVSLAK